MKIDISRFLIIDPKGLTHDLSPEAVRTHDLSPGIH
jgi:hypothetical protein